MKRNWLGQVFTKITPDKFPMLLQGNKRKFQENICIPSSTNLKKTSPCNIRVKLLKCEDKVEEKKDTDLRINSNKNNKEGTP